METLVDLSKAQLRSIGLPLGACSKILKHFVSKAIEAEILSESFVVSSTPTNVVPSPCPQGKTFADEACENGGIVGSGGPGGGVGGLGRANTQGTHLFFTF